MDTTLDDLTQGASVIGVKVYHGKTLYHFVRRSNFSDAMLHWWGFIADDGDYIQACGSRDEARSMSKCKRQWDEHRKETTA